jgi:HSP20 family protein
MHSLFFPSTFNHTQPLRDWSVADADIYENEEQFYLEIAVPGFDKENFTISASEHQVILKAEKDVTVPEGYSRIQDGRVRSNRIERTFRFKQPISAESVEAMVDNGVLTLRVPKKTTEHLVVVQAR